MEDEKIILAGLWIATMLTYLLGDVMRIFAGDFKEDEMAGEKMKPILWTIASAIMVVPIFMVVLCLMVNPSVNRILNIVFGIFFLLFNLAGMKGYKAYDQFLLIVSMVFNVIVVYFAWNWV